MASRGHTWFYVFVMEPLISYSGPGAPCPAPLVKVGIANSLDTRMDQHIMMQVVHSVHNEFIEWYSVHHPYLLNGVIQHDFVLSHARQYNSRTVAENVEKYVLRSLRKWGIIPCSGNEWFRPNNMTSFWWALYDVDGNTDESEYRSISYPDGRPRSSIYAEQHHLEQSA